jgi:aerobic-type carbon monoxide dehydrogenase small subunit (CoxS/CutS family)
MKIEMLLNGDRVEATGLPLDRLLDVLREQFGLTGTKEGCGEGECGACTVLLDGEPVLSCLVPLIQCRDRELRTVEDIGRDPQARDFLERFVAEGGSQCGACTPGIIVTAWSMDRSDQRLTREKIRTALAGNLCRCTGYEAILKALVTEAES